MSHFSLPCEDYKWLGNPSDLNSRDIDCVEENEPQGGFFEIDGKIPVELHASAKDFVFPCIN